MTDSVEAHGWGPHFHNHFHGDSFYRDILVPRIWGPRGPHFTVTFCCDDIALFFDIDCNRNTLCNFRFHKYVDSYQILTKYSIASRGLFEQVSSCTFCSSTCGQMDLSSQANLCWPLSWTLRLCTGGDAEENFEKERLLVLSSKMKVWRFWNTCDTKSITCQK